MSGPVVACIGCGGLVRAIDGPTHRYMESSPGCWPLYGEVLAREYGDSAFWASHRLTYNLAAGLIGGIELEVESRG